MFTIMGNSLRLSAFDMLTCSQQWETLTSIKSLVGDAKKFQIRKKQVQMSENKT